MSIIMKPIPIKPSKLFAIICASFIGMGLFQLWTLFAYFSTMGLFYFVLYVGFAMMLYNQYCAALDQEAMQAGMSGQKDIEDAFTKE